MRVIESETTAAETSVASKLTTFLSIALRLPAVRELDAELRESNVRGKVAERLCSLNRRHPDG